jgi:dihydrodipicolinate synthase/N-acetylneuraminate lyase
MPWFSTAAGCSNLVPMASRLLGTTGEANSFSVRERMELIEAVFEGGIPGSG